MWPKQKAKSETQALCAENQPLVDALNDLVMKAKIGHERSGTAFKVTPTPVAKNISLLDYDVTKPGSGNMLGKTVKGQKVGKVAGIGKGIAEMVDHWIDNGRQTFGQKWEEGLSFRCRRRLKRRRLIQHKQANIHTQIKYTSTQQTRRYKSLLRHALIKYTRSFRFISNRHSPSRQFLRHAFQHLHPPLFHILLRLKATPNPILPFRTRTLVSSL